MQRFARKALISSLSLLAGLALAELVTRVALSFEGASHSSAARRSAWEGQLDWILRPHGPIAMGMIDYDVADEEDLGKHAESTVLSPYLGFELGPLLADYVAHAEYFAQPEAESNFDVLVLGGSVAAIMAADAPARKALEAELAAEPRLAGRTIRLHGQARAGYKAPQTSILCELLFQLGWRPDLVVLLDGFNEVALANENRTLGAHPLYPALVNWAHLAPEVDPSNSDIDHLVEMNLAQRSARRLLEAGLEWRLYHSALGSQLLDALLSRPTKRHARALRAIEQRHSGVDIPLAIRGPVPPKSLASGMQSCLRIWVESAVSLAAACRARGIPFLHVLQPTLHDVGAKPMTPNEARVGRISDAWKEGVLAGYPLLREQGAELTRRGVHFVDGSGLFKDWADDLYYDACHVTSPGSQALARFIGEQARALPDLVPSRD
ncbi:MAG: hypothetical protein R3F49_18295 [Planctomycetota bacterium]